MPKVSQAGEIDDLVERAGRGDLGARQELLGRHRARLRQMVAIRLDGRLAARVDASDIVQEALGDAARHFEEYLRDRPMPFYPWLRRLAWERLVEAQRRHIVAGRRSVTREQAAMTPPVDGSAGRLVDRLLASGTSPSRRMIRDEARLHLLATLDAMPPRDREVLVLRYLEGLSTAEAAAVLGIQVGAVMTRHTRALARLRGLFGEGRDPEEGAR